MEAHRDAKGHGVSCMGVLSIVQGRTRTCSLLLRRQTPSPLGHMDARQRLLSPVVSSLTTLLSSSPRIRIQSRKHVHGTERERCTHTHALQLCSCLRSCHPIQSRRSGGATHRRLETRQGTHPQTPDKAVVVHQIDGSKRFLEVVDYLKRKLRNQTPHLVQHINHGDPYTCPVSASM